ncbi:glycine betaine ABC transporter substrate-binding protein [uncultured Desulfosarcina sp.]|uniref:glycine betaine ABC transporter substrate-binding protein n=1 Tax=uncultured Desulfosarcina sp. TaxID=218289 RepID=UPI0029C84EFD|nr:glycine betaine ABC transporter substrate-binding protein [uncultured Desulfosarcina sp.]
MSKFKSVVFLLLIISVISIVLVAPPLWAASAQKEKAVFFVSFWSGDWLPTYVPKMLLEEKLGYEVKVESLSVPAGFTAISSGEVSVTVITWMPNNDPLVKKYLGKTMVDLGTMYPDCYQTLFVPKWVSDKYGIKKISDLDNPAYAKLFDIDLDKKGDWLGCDPAWICAKMNDECILAYGLEKLFVQMMGEEHMLTAVIKGRMKSNKPVLVSQFYPHIMFLDYPIGESVVALEDDLNYWPKPHVEKFANKTWVEKNPKAAELVRQVNMTTGDIMWSMDYLKKNGDSPEVIERMTREWMKAHQEEVNTWLKAVE